jgi:hypothetical protein
VAETDTSAGSYSYHDAGTDTASTSAPEDLEDAGTYDESGKDTTTIHESGQKAGLDGGTATFTFDLQSSDTYTLHAAGTDDNSPSGGAATVTYDAKGSSTTTYSESGGTSGPSGGDSYTFDEGSAGSYSDHDVTSPGRKDETLTEDGTDSNHFHQTGYTTNPDGTTSYTHDHGSADCYTVTDVTARTGWDTTDDRTYAADATSSWTDDSHRTAAGTGYASTEDSHSTESTHGHDAGSESFRNGAPVSGSRTATFDDLGSSWYDAASTYTDATGGSSDHAHATDSFAGHDTATDRIDGTGLTHTDSYTFDDAGTDSDTAAASHSSGGSDGNGNSWTSSDSSSHDAADTFSSHSESSYTAVNGVTTASHRRNTSDDGGSWHDHSANSSSSAGPNSSSSGNSSSDSGQTFADHWDDTDGTYSSTTDVSGYSRYDSHSESSSTTATATATSDHPTLTSTTETGATGTVSDPGGGGSTTSTSTSDSHSTDTYSYHAAYSYTPGQTGGGVQSFVYDDRSHSWGSWSSSGSGPSSGGSSDSTSHTHVEWNGTDYTVTSDWSSSSTWYPVTPPDTGSSSGGGSSTYHTSDPGVSVPPHGPVGRLRHSGGGGGYDAGYFVTGGYTVGDGSGGGTASGGGGGVAPDGPVEMEKPGWAERNGIWFFGENERGKRLDRNRQRLYDAHPEWGPCPPPDDTLFQAMAKAAGEGLKDGGAIVANTFTFGAIPSLNTYVEKVVEENGGLYKVAQTSAVIGREALLTAVSGGASNVIKAGQCAGYAARTVGAARAVKGALTVKDAYDTTQSALATYQAIRKGDGWGAAFNGAMTALGVKGLKGSFKELRTFNCFVAGTPVLTPAGPRPIESLRAGDLVLSRAEHDPDAPLAVRRVVEAFARVGPVLDVVVEGRVIGTTGEHPFYVRGRGWQEAGALRPGDELVSHDGVPVRVRGVNDGGRSVAVYNLHVDEHHTYFVGGDEWGFSVWVHNVYTHKQAIKDVEEMVKAGVPGADKLLAMLNGNFKASAKAGYRFQAQRAAQYYRQGLLGSVEAAANASRNPPRIDIVLKDGLRIETKAWGKFKSPEALEAISKKPGYGAQLAADLAQRQNKQLAQLSKEVRDYLAAPGSSLHVEFNKVIPSQVEQLLKQLKVQFPNLTWGKIP